MLEGAYTSDCDIITMKQKWHSIPYMVRSVLHWVANVFWSVSHLIPQFGYIVAVATQDPVYKR